MNNTSKPPVLDPAVQKLLDEFASTPGPKIHELPVEDARHVFLDMQSISIPKLPADIEDHTLPIGPRGSVLIRIVKPQGIAGPLPAVMYFHGGGWVVGDRETHDRLLRELANGANAAIVFVEYSRSPESCYPVANEEAYAATQWIAEHGDELGLDSTRLTLAGDSAGGNMATVVSMLAKQRGGPNIDLQILFCPTLDASTDPESYRQFGAGYALDLEAMEWFWNHYFSASEVRFEPTASPLRASLQQLAELPPTLIITAECDVLRDEAEVFAGKLMQAGVQVTATRYLGAIHDFMVHNALAEMPATRAAVAQANAALRQVFHSRPERVAA